MPSLRGERKNVRYPPISVANEPGRRRITDSRLPGGSNPTRNDQLWGAFLPESSALGEWPVLAGAAVQSSIGVRRILVGSECYARPPCSGLLLLIQQTPYYLFCFRLRPRTRTGTASKHRLQPIISKVREAENVPTQGGTVAAACRRISLNKQSYCRSRKEYGRPEDGSGVTGSDLVRD